MYQKEFECQTEKLEQQKMSAKNLETTLRTLIAEQKKEIEELNL